MRFKKIFLGALAFAGAFLFAIKISANTLGFDVASYQDSSVEYFQQMKAKGAQFDLVKLGGSGGNEGAHYQNPKASAQLANSAIAGLNTGSYFWGQFGSNQSSAANMAQLAISDAKRSGLKTNSVIALDYEAGASNNVEANTAAIKVFMSDIQKAGYKAVLYSGANYLKTYVNVNEIGKQFGTRVWSASYKTTNLQVAPDFGYFPSMNYIAMWQYGNNWFGVDGNVDLIGLMTTGGVNTNTPVKPVTPQNSNNTAKTYVVKSGDSWWLIANRVGVDMNLLAKLNGKTISSVIYPGQVLKISGTIDNNVSKDAAKNTKAPGNSAAASLPAGVHAQNGYFHPNQRLMVWTSAGYGSTGVYYYPGESIHYQGYIRNGAYIYVVYQSASGHWRYVADRRAATSYPLGWFE
ncbi:MAG: GH25 family lysozyme [Liquorilactobacillus ghanensis]|uniref:GH25 family lysozyme n=1 Tax=Liquorilactobacillus ghanensis TaxID=399370 RepID=UPI0039EA99FE